MPKVPDGFRIKDDDDTRAYCTLCYPEGSGRKYIKLNSIKTHIKSDRKHLAAAQARMQSTIAREHRRNLQNTEVQQEEQGSSNSLKIDHTELNLPRMPNIPTVERPRPAPEFWDNGDFEMLGPDNEVSEEAQLRKDVNRLLTGINDDSVVNALGMAEPEDDLDTRLAVVEAEEEERMLTDMMENAAIHDQVLDRVLHGASNSTSAEWTPYSSKTAEIQMCILDVLDNLPRIRISDSLMKMFIWALKECGAPDTPSFYALRKAQKHLRETQGIPSLECRSVQGKVFYVNDPRAIIANDWNNPSVRPHIHLYPEIPEDGIIREVWHGQKWRKDMDLDVLSPMFDAGNGRHYYVFELSRLKSGLFVVPIRWVVVNNQVCADAFNVEIDSDGVASLNDSDTVLINSNELDGNFFDLEHEGLLPTKWSETTQASGYLSKMPNHYRDIAQGDPLYTSFIDYFGDDVSGNRSKSWNKHNNSYMTHRNLPRKLLQQEFHVHMLSTSQHATISEQYHEVKKIIETTRKDPVRVVNTDGSNTRFMLQTHAAPSDNPAQSEIASNIGAKGNFPCRKCDAGGSEEHRCTNGGFHDMCGTGNPRNRELLINELAEQVHLACRGVKKPIIDRQRDTGTKDAFTQYWIEYLIDRFHSEKQANPHKTRQDIESELLAWVELNKDKIYSGFLTTKGFDPAKDTPVEILHTILLGVVKYIWHYSHSKWPKDKALQKETYRHRLQATDTTGLSINAIRADYIIGYANSLIGRQLKTIIQTAVFQLYDLVDEDHLKVWKAVAQLSALLWFTEIDDIDQYCNDLKIAVANVQDTFSLIDPTKMIRKIKLHLLGHIPEDARAFGTLLGEATELYESFNAVFRSCSVLSNHLAPSRDIARQLGDQESLKHRLMSGKWLDSIHNEWTQSGSGVLELFKNNRFLQPMVGWTVNDNAKPGTVVQMPRKAGTNREVKLQETPGKNAVNNHDFDLVCTRIKCTKVIAASGDECPIGSFVFCRSPIQDKIIIGRIAMILFSASETITVLEQFEISDRKEPFFDMPYIFRRQGEVSHIILPSTRILFIQNVQHDCRTAKCTATGTRKRMQERLESDQTESFIEHKSDDRYIINLCAFHNAHLVRRVLPRELVAPVPLFPDRVEQHSQFAGNLRGLLKVRKEETKKKKEATAVQKSAGENTGGRDAQTPAPNRPRPQPRPLKRTRQNSEDGDTD